MVKKNDNNNKQNRCCKRKQGDDFNLFYYFKKKSLNSFSEKTKTTEKKINKLNMYIRATQFHYCFENNTIFLQAICEAKTQRIQPYLPQFSIQLTGKLARKKSPSVHVMGRNKASIQASIVDY